MSLTWYLGYTKPRLESVAKANLERQGYGCFLPLVKKERLVRGKKISKLEPLFSRYLFILSDSTSGLGLAPIKSTLGMSGLVMSNGLPQGVPEGLVAAIQSRLADESSLLQSLYQSGDRVRIVAGPFSGLEAIYDTDAAEDRAFLLLELLGRTNQLSFSFNQLEKL